MSRNSRNQRKSQCFFVQWTTNDRTVSFISNEPQYKHNECTYAYVYIAYAWGMPQWLRSPYMFLAGCNGSAIKAQSTTLSEPGISRTVRPMIAVTVCRSAVGADDNSERLQRYRLVSVSFERIKPSRGLGALVLIWRPTRITPVICANSDMKTFNATHRV